MKDAKQIVSMPHTLEEIFNIQPGTTPTPVHCVEVEDVEQVADTNVPYDDLDKSIDEQINDVYRIAINTAMDVQDAISSVEPSKRARSVEALATILNVGLNAAKIRADVKSSKERNSAKGPTNVNHGVVNQTVFVGTREEALKHLPED